MFNLSKIDVEFNFSSTQQRNFQTETQMFCIHRKVPETSKYAMLCQMIDNGLIIVMDLLNSFRDGNDFNLRQSQTLFCWIVVSLGLKESSQHGETNPFIFHFINSRFCFIFVLHIFGFFVEIGTHPN